MLRYYGRRSTMLLESGNNGVFMARNVANALVFAVSQTRNIGK